jgi:glycosyl transferase family 2
MKLIMTLLVRNEEDIVRANMEYHLSAGVDYIIVTENLSTDSTRDIILEYERKGVAHYFCERRDNFDQSAWVTRMARMAADRFGADWVINSDADEFWWPENGALKTVLARVPEKNFGLLVERHNFVPRVEPVEGNFLFRMRYRETRSLNDVGYRLAAKTCHRASSAVIVLDGNHRVTIDDEQPDLSPTDKICIFHYPLRTRAQFDQKIALGAAALQRSGRPKTIGRAWRKLYSMQQASGLQDYFEQAYFDYRRLAEGLAAGEIIEDRRLADYFVRHGLPV